MKRFLLTLAMGALFLPALQSAQAQEDVSINFFYDNLNGGNWYQVADYGYVWQPEVASGASWRPYTDGYWAYTDVGWTWVSYEDFGWATYHYGRWTQLTDYGWVWVPGYEWGPAWVSWRTGGDYVGWAPLPPAGPRGEIVYDSRPITGHVDVEFGIGPAYYNFIDVRYIGEPVLRDRILGYDRNVVIINNTVNVTNITYNNSVVYNYGPDYAVLSRYSVRPIQRLTIERESIDPLTAVRGGNITKVQGNKLLLAAPLKLEKSATPIAPQKIKGKIDQPKFEKGWGDVKDPAAKAKLEEKFKTENAKNIPKPTLKPNPAVNTEVSPNANNGAASLNAGASPTPAQSPMDGKGKRKGEKFQPGASAPPAASMAPSEQKRSKKGNQGNEIGASATPGSSPLETGEGKGKKNKNRGENIESTPKAMVTPKTESRNFTSGNAGEGGKHKGNKTNAEIINPNAAPGAEQSEKLHEKSKAMPRPVLNNPNVSTDAGTQSHGGGGGAGKSREQFRPQVQQQIRGDQPRGGNNGGGEEKEKKNKGEKTPPPQ